MLPSLTIQEPLYWPAGKPKQTPPGRPIPDSEIHLLVQDADSREIDHRSRLKSITILR